MVKFECKSCRKVLDLEDKIYEKAYKEQGICLDCRSKNHGGSRKGSGRPSLGTTKKVSITLPDEVWEQLNEAKGEESMSSFLRRIITDGNWI